MNEWERFTETDREHEKGEKDFDDEKRTDFFDREHDEDFKERKVKDWEDISKRLKNES